MFQKDGTEILVIRKNAFEVEVENLDYYDGFKIHAVYLLMMKVKHYVN